MNIVFDSYSANQPIPVTDFLRKKKLAKFFNRETASAVVSVAKLLGPTRVLPDTPLYYACGLVEHEDYGLDTIVEASLDGARKFSQELFVHNGLSGVSPLSQFKVLYNMPVCFISIEHGLTGDNAVIYSGATGLLLQCMNAPCETPFLAGAGKMYENGQVETAFVLAAKSEIEQKFKSYSCEAIDMLREWAREEGCL